MALDLVEIRMILSGAKKLVAEADAASEAIAGTGAASKEANAAAAASGKKAVGTLGKTASKLRSINSGMRSLGSGMTKYATLPILAAAAASVDMGLKFEKSVQMLHTQAGVAKGELKGLQKDFLEVARVTTFSPTEISEGAFRLAGAGLRGKKLEEATLQSSQLAMVGEANPEDTFKTLGQVWYSRIKGSQNFAKDVAEINATVGAGDLRVPQLIDALGTGVTASAKKAGFSLRELNATMAVFGDNTNNVSGWAAQWATGLHYFTSPGEKAAKAMESIGLAEMQLGETGRNKGQVAMLEQLDEHLARLPGGLEGSSANKVLGEILPGGRGRVFGVLLQQFDKLIEKEQTIGKGSGLKKWHKIIEETNLNPQIQLEKAWNNIKVIFTEVGLALIPILIPALHKLVEGIHAVSQWFLHLSPAGKKVALIVVGIIAVLGPLLMILSLLLPAIEAIVAVIAFLFSPITLVIVAIAALAAGLYYAYHHVEWFHDAVDNVVGFIKSNWKWLGPLLIAPFLPVVAVIALVIIHLHWFENAFHNVVNFIRSVPHRVMAGLHALPHLIGALLAKLVVLWATLPYRIFRLQLKLVGLVIKATLTLGPKLLVAGIHALLWLLKGIESGWAVVLAWFQSLPGTLASLVVSLAGQFLQIGANIAKEVATGFFNALPGPIKGAFELGGEVVGGAGEVAEGALNAPGEALNSIGGLINSRQTGTDYWGGVTPTRAGAVRRGRHVTTGGHTGSAPASRGGHTYVRTTITLPNGRVLAEETKKAEDDAGARL